MPPAPQAPTQLQLAIRRAIAESGKTRDYFDSKIQRRTGKTGKPIYDIDRGKSKKPSVEMLQFIADAFDKPLSYFTTNYDLLISQPGGEGPSAIFEMKQQKAKGSEHAVQLKQIDLAFSMGAGANIDDYVEEGTLEFDAGLLSTITRSPADRLFVARGDGDSMMPTLIDNDMVIVDTLQKQLNLQDRIWACSIHGAGAIKRLRAIGKQRVLVISDNSTVDNQEVDAEDLFILGRVIWVGRRV